MKQAARELLLAQSSDWPFILHTGTSPDYAAPRVKEHLRCFLALHDQLTRQEIDEAWLAGLEWTDNLFPTSIIDIGCKAMGVLLICAGLRCRFLWGFWPRF